MNICTKKDIKVLTGVMAASLLLGGCAGRTPSSKPLKNDPSVKAAINFDEVKKTEYDKDLMDAEYRRYCFDLLSQTVRDYGGEGNVMISPASIMMALDMVAAGAKEDSLRQLTDLFAVGQGPLSQQAYAASLMDKINNSKDVDFSCANAVWNNSLLLGDMVISMERCAAQAEEFGHSFQHEVTYLAIHSTLHLLGYDHVDEGEQKKQMRTREKEILNILGEQDL